MIIASMNSKLTEQLVKAHPNTVLHSSSTMTHVTCVAIINYYNYLLINSPCINSIVESSLIILSTAFCI